ncbi:hypothetical protein [Pseudomonas entomophila]|uniref:Uncharacterized protein n=1 Tax=Pseudomonas entomophila TaxID=312306 RepID=A0ABY9QKY1_9PSED|nr:hypothetical protein [Pseudomonas entomophila]WMW04708.1 hypothetical protein RAH46_20580 [Pseudomonas entomophila]
MDDSGMEDSGGQNLTQKSGFCKLSKRSLGEAMPTDEQWAPFEGL